MQRDLDSGALASIASQASSAQPCRNDTRVVDDETIARAQQLGKIAHGAVLARAVLAHHEKPRRIARGRGAQRDLLFRQIEIELIDAHYPTLFSTAATMRSWVASSR